MLSLVYKILFSILLAAVLLYLLEITVTTGLEYNRNYKISYIKNHKIDADLLVHGPCESEQAIDPDILSKYVPYRSYNLSLIHSDFADNYLFLVQYLKYQAKPKAVLLYVAPESFDSVMTNTFNSYRFAHMVNDPGVKETIKDIDPDYAALIDIPFMRYSYYSNFIFYKSLSGWVDLIRGNKITQWPNGYVKPEMPWNKPFKDFKELNLSEGSFLWSYSRETYFLKIIDLLKQNNIALVLYTSPSYYEVLPLQKNRDSHIKRIEDISIRYKVPYLKLDSLNMMFDKNYFFTIDNFTVAGNEVFNPILGNILKDTLPSLIDSTKIKEEKEYKVKR